MSRRYFPIIAYLAQTKVTYRVPELRSKNTDKPPSLTDVHSLPCFSVPSTPCHSQVRGESLCHTKAVQTHPTLSQLRYVTRANSSSDLSMLTFPLPDLLKKVWIL